MSERKWTKGNWEVRDVHGELHVHAPDTFGHGYRLQMRVAQDIGGYKTEREDGSWDESEVIANARLIAAAPDLYEALFLATRYITAIESFLGKGLEVEGWHMNGDKELFDNFFDQNRGEFDLAKARAALQRAEGE